MKETAGSIRVCTAPRSISAASPPLQAVPCKLVGCCSAQWVPASAPRQLPALLQVGSYSKELIKESIGVIIMNKTAGVNQTVLSWRLVFLAAVPFTAWHSKHPVHLFTLLLF